jgi:8-oxo-dGTP diphosphatase
MPTCDTFRFERYIGEMDGEGRVLPAPGVEIPLELYCYQYERPAVAVDLVVFSRPPLALFSDMEVLLIRRGKEPWKGQWALPGGFLNPDETTEDAALREAREETGIESLPRPSLLGVFDRPDRDPRGRVISVAYWAVVTHRPEVKGGDDAAAARWVPVAEARKGRFAADHREIFRAACLTYGVE